MKFAMRYIYLIGSFIFLWALLKYLFIDVQLPIGFISFELLSFLFILGMVYFSSLNCRKSKEFQKKLEDRLWSKEAELQEEISDLKKELHVYKNQELNQRDFQSNKEVLMEKIFHLVTARDTASTISEELIRLLKQYFEVGAAIGYVFNSKTHLFDVHCRFGIEDDSVIKPIKIGEGIHGQSLADNQPVLVKNIPEEYIDIQSAIGKSKPRFLYLLPLLLDDERRIILEVATFKNEGIELIWNEIVVQMKTE
ncbi:MAG: hypothetical protein JEZ14_04085 [Marinilabiliaceae bacterium]|nr:hypothetical protein [Marinilabiliaceae bacterium]